MLLATAAQPPGTVYRIGYLVMDLPLTHLWDALLDGLRERGYIEGRNLVFERRFSEGNAERFPAFAAELVRLRVDCIIVPTTPAVLAVKHATTTMPIVMTTAIDPVGAGLVARQPGAARRHLEAKPLGLKKVVLKSVGLGCLFLPFPLHCPFPTFLCV